MIYRIWKLCLHFLSSNISPKNIWVIHLNGKWLWFYMTLWLWEWKWFQVLPNSFSYLLMKWLQLTIIDGWGSIHMCLRMEMNAHFIHFWKGDHMCYYSKLTQVLLHVLLSFGNVNECLNNGLKVNVTWDWWWKVYVYQCAQLSHHSYRTQCSFLCMFIILHTKLACLWKFYLPNHWSTTLKSLLLKYIFNFLNLEKRFLNLKGLIFCWIWKHWKSFEMWRYVGCQCFFLSKCWQNTSPSSCKCG